MIDDANNLATGSGIGIGGTYGSHKARDREGRSVVVKSSLREERGRDRTGRRIGDSLSPPNMVGSPVRSVSDDFPAYAPVTQGAGSLPPPSPSLSSSGSSLSGSSTASSATAKPGDDEDRVRGRTSLLVSTQRSGIPPPIPEEEETTRSRQPTPANSPVRALSHHPISPSSIAQLTRRLYQP